MILMLMSEVCIGTSRLLLSPTMDRNLKIGFTTKLSSVFQGKQIMLCPFFTYVAQPFSTITNSEKGPILNSVLAISCLHGNLFFVLTAS